MKNTQNTNEHAFGLIIDEIDGLLTKEGKAELQQWIVADTENARTYQEFRELNRRLDMISAQKDLRPEESWSILEAKLDPVHRVTIKRKFLQAYWPGIAAVLIVLICFGIYFSQYNSSVTVSTAFNEQRVLDLPDGSVISLNGNTVLEYNAAQFERERKILLVKGEAFFDVRHDPHKLFTIEMGTVRVVDLGTSFNVIRSPDQINVVVNSGKVAFEQLSAGSSLVLTAGNKAVYRMDKQEFSSSVNHDLNYKAWLDKKLTFVGTPLSEVASQLGKTYACTVTLTDPSLKTRQLNGTLNYATPDSALTVISESLGLKVRRSGTNFFLSK